MFQLIQAVNAAQRKKKVVDARSGDTVRVHQKIKEGNKERIQVFEGVVIRTSRKDSLTSTITVRRIASGVGVEKTFMLHSPLVLQVEITKRGKVRRKYLTYLRARSGKSARLTSVDFDRNKVNAANRLAEEELEAIKEEQQEAHEAEAAAEAEADEKALEDRKAAADKKAE
jgi:large subunit ribosomal protein L19